MFAQKIQPVPTNVRVTTVIVTMVFTKKATSVSPIVIKISARVQVHTHPISAQNGKKKFILKFHDLQHLFPN